MNPVVPTICLAFQQRCCDHLLYERQLLALILRFEGRIEFPLLPSSINLHGIGHAIHPSTGNIWCFKRYGSIVLFSTRHGQVTPIKTVDSPVVYYCQKLFNVDDMMGCCGIFVRSDYISELHIDLYDALGNVLKRISITLTDSYEIEIHGWYLKHRNQIYRWDICGTCEPVKTSMTKEIIIHNDMFYEIVNNMLRGQSLINDNFTLIPVPFGFDSMREYSISSGNTVYLILRNRDTGKSSLAKLNSNQQLCLLDPFYYINWCIYHPFTDQFIQIN